MDMTTRNSPSPPYCAYARLLPLLIAIVLAGAACVRPVAHPTHGADQSAAISGDDRSSCTIVSRIAESGRAETVDPRYAEDEEDGDDTLADEVLNEIAELDEALAALDDADDRSPGSEESNEYMADIDARMQLVSAAVSKLGARYRRGGSGESGFDCSGFTGWVYGNVGVDLPRTSQSQFLEGRSVRREHLQPGDLVFFKRSKKRRIHHVGIYLEDGKFIHSSSSDGVVISRLDARPWCTQWAGAKRVL